METGQGLFRPGGLARFSESGPRRCPPGSPVIDGGCLGCGLCRDQCPADAIEIRDGKYGIGPACRGCLACLEVCPVGAVRLRRQSLKLWRLYGD